MYECIEVSFLVAKVHTGGGGGGGAHGDRL